MIPTDLHFQLAKFIQKINTLLVKITFNATKKKDPEEFAFPVFTENSSKYL